jgi:hypothetical protein
MTMDTNAETPTREDAMKKMLIAGLAALAVMSAALAVEAAPPMREILYTKKVKISYWPAWYTVRFSLWDAETGGTMAWSEEKAFWMPTGSTVSHYLGSINPLPVPFNQQYWVQCDLLQGGPGVAEASQDGPWIPQGARDRLLTAPYSLWAVDGVGMNDPRILHDLCLALDLRGLLSQSVSCPPPETRFVFITNQWVPSDMMFGGPSSVSRTKLPPGMNALDVADMVCQEEAVRGGLRGVYRAWLSIYDEESVPREAGYMIPGQNPQSRFNKYPTSRYVLPDPNRTLLAEGWDDLTDGYLASPIFITATGEPVGLEEFCPVWTDTTPAGFTAGFESCQNWTSGYGYGVFGDCNSSDPGWTMFDSMPCCMYDAQNPLDNGYCYSPAWARLYCVQQ